MTLREAKNIAGDRTGFYPDALKTLAKKFIVEHGTDEDKKVLQRAVTKHVVRLGNPNVQRLGDYNETNSDSLASVL